MVSAPTRRVSERRAGDLATTCWTLGHDHLNQRSGFPPVQCLPIHKESKKAPGVPGLQVVSNKGEAPNGNEPLDAPILSQSTNQTRRGSRKRLTRRRGHPSAGQGRPQRPMGDIGGVMTNWANVTPAAWFGAQNCYLAMAAMR